MESHYPPLTIAIPSYKRAHAILPLLQIIATEAGPEDDLIVVDDASGDDIETIVSQVKGFRLVANPINIGMVANWNACLKEARNDWICIVHHDDMIVTGAIEAMRHACRIAGGPAAIVHWRSGAEVDKVFRYRWCDPGPWAVLNVPTIPSGAIVHRAIVDRLGGFDPQWKYSSDMEYFPRICREFPLLVIESPAIVSYKMHKNNYQYSTWRESDFEDQLTGIVVAVAKYAGLTGKVADEHIKNTMRGLFHHMFSSLLWLGDRSLLKLVSRRFLKFGGLGVKTRVLATLAAITGWCPRPATHHLAAIGSDSSELQS